LVLEPRPPILLNRYTHIGLHQAPCMIKAAGTCITLHYTSAGDIALCTDLRAWSH
jgi:hypothetical protein